jgi:hypothetical protein
MTDFYNILFFTTIVLVIEFYSEIHLRNYGTIGQRVFHLLGIKTLFNIFKISVLFGIIYIGIDLYKLYDFLDWRFVESRIVDLSAPKYQYLVVPFSFSIIIILINADEIFKKLRVISTSQKQLDSFVTNVMYILFRLLSFALTFMIFKTILHYIMALDVYFDEKDLYILDWLIVDKDGQDNYNKGVYFSLILTSLAFILFNNAFIKKNSDNWDYRRIKLDFFKYFLITIILCIGLFFGFFSIFNGIFNILNSNFSEWFSKENILGIFPIRMSSLLIIIYLSTYIYKQVLKGNLGRFLVLGLLPIRSVQDYDNFIIFRDRETLFFSQISFYILNIALAELYIIFGYKSIYLSVLNFSILFILDDFKIISDYSKNLRSVLTSHFVRIWLFNLIMLFSSVVLLIKKDHHALLVLYMVLTFILFRYYYKNSGSINFERY